MQSFVRFLHLYPLEVLKWGNNIADYAVKEGRQHGSTKASQADIAMKTATSFSTGAYMHVQAKIEGKSIFTKGAYVENQICMHGEC